MVTFFSCFLKSEKYELGIYLTKLDDTYVSVLVINDRFLTHLIPINLFRNKSNKYVKCVFLLT